MSISISELLYQNLCRSNAICMYLDHVLGTILPDILYISKRSDGFCVHYQACRMLGLEPMMLSSPIPTSYSTLNIHVLYYIHLKYKFINLLNPGYQTITKRKFH